MGDTRTGKTIATDLEYQEAILQEVSRTFALTIPKLPEALRRVVGNAYLLCRLADTIEDSAALNHQDKGRFLDMVTRMLEGDQAPEEFSRTLGPLLAADTSEAERDLVRNTDRVLRVTRSFTVEERAALARCVRIMGEGMDFTQEGRWTHGLPDMPHLDTYCYHVAGVVGEMLTELFCLHSPETARRRNALSRLAVSFGEGLQLTNILADVWDDKKRNVCWLPRDRFARHGFDLATLSVDCHGPAFEAGLAEMIAVARGHLKNALAYTTLLPKSERGIRQFCLLAIGMAVLTLRKINRRRDFTTRAEVKISRRAVYAVVLVAKLAGQSNFILRALFAAFTATLPTSEGH